MSTASVIGFGTRTPQCVLELLSKASKQGFIQTISPVRSCSLELALLSPPYRTFLRNNTILTTKTTTTTTTTTKELIVLCLPNVSEYTSCVDEVNSIRSKLLSNSGNVLVVVYDPSKHHFLTEEPVDSILAALQSNSATINSAALMALSQLDLKASTQLNPVAGTHHTVIVVGSGGREHAIAVALAKSPLVAQVIVCPGNGGTAKETSPKIVNAPSGYTQSNDSVIKLVKETAATLVAVGPEAPLVDGLVDALAVECPGVLAFGPTKAAAELEASKVIEPILSHCCIRTSIV